MKQHARISRSQFAILSTLNKAVIDIEALLLSGCGCGCDVCVYSFNADNDLKTSRSTSSIIKKSVKDDERGENMVDEPEEKLEEIEEKENIEHVTDIMQNHEEYVEEEKENNNSAMYTTNISEKCEDQEESKNNGNSHDTTKIYEDCEEEGLENSETVDLAKMYDEDKERENHRKNVYFKLSGRRTKTNGLITACYGNY